MTGGEPRLVYGELGPFEGAASDRVVLGSYERTGTWAPQLLTLLCEHLLPTGGTLLDGGAHIGLVSIPVARRTGAHALAFEVTAGIASLPPRRGVRGHLDRRRPVTSYDAYLKARNLDAKEWASGADLGLSATIRFRERDADIAFVGAKCRRCGQVHFPKPRVCYGCHAKDEWDRYRLSDKRGRLLSYTFDYFFPAAQPPTIMTMTEVDGCRVQVQLVNARPEDTKLDLPVEYVFRKIHNAGGKPNYFWKATPVLEGA